MFATIRQRDLLVERAHLDPLTGIANRRRFDAAFDQAWHAAARDAKPLALMLLDVDHFKQFNDHYGHGAGDDCLKRIAAVLHAEFADDGQLAARIGGEEFAILTAGGATRAHALKLLSGVRHLAIPHAYSSAGPIVSVSAGALELVPQPGAPPRLLLEAADALLYDAKRAGRNRCLWRSAVGADVDVVTADSLDV